MNIIAFSGSLRGGSLNTALVRGFQSVAPEGVTIEMLSIGNLPLYDETLEASYPAEAQALKDKIIAADAVIFATPEYNRSIPGVLKNAIDWVSRPYGTNPFAGKPVLISGVSMGKVGAAIAQSHLRTVMSYLDAQVLGQPELYLGPGEDLFDASGAIKEDSTKETLRKALAMLIERAR